MASKIHPRNGLVTIMFEPEAKETKTASGIFIPTTAGMVFTKARVVEVGPGVSDGGHLVGTADLKPGMLVLVKKEIREDLRTVARVTVELKEGDLEVHLINQQDIFAVLDEEPVPALKIAGGDAGNQGTQQDEHDDGN